MQKQNHLEQRINHSQIRQSQNETYRGADLILHYLEQIGVEFIFGIPGGGIEPLYNALARSQRRGGPRPIIARHESGAAFMADGYARETGKLGACCATTGPGATNMITGVASAYMDHVPLLAITAQTSLKTFGRGAFQESTCTSINTVAMYQHCTRYNSLVSHIEQLESKLISAITTAIHPPCGPVHLSIPLDILRAPIAFDTSSKLHRLLSPSASLDIKAVDQLYHTLYSARNIVFFLGAGARQAMDAILELSSFINAHLITTPNAKGLVSSFHPQYRGVYGISGHNTANALLNTKTVDVILAIGTTLDEFSTNGWEATPLFSKKLILIDTTPLYFSRLPMARQHISGNLKTVFAHLTARFKRIRKTDKKEGVNWRRIQESTLNDTTAIPFDRRTNHRRRDHSRSTYNSVTYLYKDDRRQNADRRNITSRPPAARHFTLEDEDKYLSDAIPIKPQRLMYDLSRLFPPNTRFLSDIGNSMYWAIHYLHPFRGKEITGRPSTTNSVRIGLGFASMGWGIGAAVGTALAAPGKPVVCITGDGALLMSGQELTTAVQEKLPVIFVVLNDSALGAVKHGQQMGGAELIGFELPNIDFVAYAESMGAKAYLITSPQDLADLAIKDLCTDTGPTILDVRIDPNEVPPITQRIKLLEGGAA